MIDAIKIISKETNKDWSSIMQALRDRNIINSEQYKNIENHFFDEEYQSG